MRVRAAATILMLALFAGALAGSLNPVRAADLPTKIPVTVSADKLDYDRATDVYIAVGHVKIDQKGTHLEADKVVLNNKTGEANAEGSVYLQDQGNVVRAERMKTNLNTSEGVIYKGDLFLKKDNYHLKGDLIERRSETVYHVEHGEFTTCDDDDWFIKAGVMDVDMNRYATGRGVTFNVAGVPVVYTPYILFPVRRQTGLLIPNPGYSSTDGFFMDNAFFWAISDYTDMTLYSDYRAKVGHGTGVEYRYNNSTDSRGQVYAKYWDMYHTGDARWEFQFQHQEEFAEDLSARADINLVSDDLYYHDLDKRLEVQSKPYLDSNAFYVERWNTASLYLLGQYSTDLTQSNGKTVQKVPELKYTIYEESLIGPLHLNFEGSTTNFSIQDDNGARRVDFNPQLTAAFGGGGLSFTPRAGARATLYDRSATTMEPTERRYAYAGADLNARISRVYGVDGDAGIGRVRHSIEPTVSYVYIPYIDQADIPVFDAVDAVTETNTVTAALVNRLTAHYKASKDAAQFTSFDLVVFKLSQSYDLNAARNPTGSARPLSDLIAELSVSPPRLFSMTATADYNTYDKTMVSHTVGAVMTTSVITMSLTEQTSLPSTQYLIGGVKLNLSKWNLTGSWSKDMENDVLTQEAYGVNYMAQCWTIRTTYTHTPGDERYTVMVDLKGLGSRGTK